MDFGIAAYNTLRFAGPDDAPNDCEREDAAEWTLSGIYIFINIPLWLAPWPFLLFVCKRWPDCYATRCALRKTCTMVNMKQLVGILFLLFEAFVVRVDCQLPDGVWSDEPAISLGRFSRAISGQMIYFFAYIYL